MAQQVPNASLGFRPEKVFDLGEFDDVSIYSGSLSVALPLGPSYPRDAGRSLQLSLNYISSAWTYRVDFTHWEDCIYPPEEQCRPVESQPKAYARGGLGWMVSLGELLAPNNLNIWNPVPGFVYVSSDGAEHTFFNTLREADPEDPGDSGSTQLTRYTRDGSFLRLRQVTANVDYRVDLPNGDQHLFHNYGTSAGPDYRLSTITDPFGNVVTLTYGADHLEISDGYRTHRIEYETTGLPHQPRVISKVRTACFQCEADAYGDYVFSYATADVDPPPGNSFLYWPGPRTVRLLTSITRPDGLSIGFQYSSSLQGLMTRADLHTGGALEWQWGAIDFPAFRKNRQVDVEPGDEDVYQTTFGVSARRHRDASNAIVGEWTYARQHDGTFNQPAEEFRVTVVTPLKDKSEHYFSVYPVIWTTGNPPPQWGTKAAEFGLPFTRATPDAVVGDSVQRYLSSEHFDCNASGEECVKKRSVFVAYELDDALQGQSPFGALFNKNRRVLSERTVYHDDGNRWTLRTHQAAGGGIDYDGLGRYRRVRTLANFGSGDSREVYTAFNAHQAPPIAPATRWILGNFSRVDTTEGGVSTRQQYRFNNSTGFLNCVRTLENGSTPGSHDVLLRFTGSAAGNVVREHSYGGDRQVIATTGACSDASADPASDIEQIWEHGALKRAKYASMTWNSLDLDLDANTGLPIRSRDVAGVASDLAFDSMGRLAKFIPQAEAGLTADASTIYTWPTVGNSDTLTIARCPPGTDSCDAGNRLSQQYFDYDALGRLYQEGRQLPSGAYSVRELLYDAAGNRWKVSTYKPVAGQPHYHTVFSSYDAFGRPGTITAPDGKVTSIVYTGVRQVQTTRPIALELGGGEVNVARRETFDGQGRLFRVEEPSLPAPASAYVTTEYGYHVGGGLARVCQNVSAGTCGQERLFQYDRRGFLLSETHPEKGVEDSGGGTVTYSGYDSRGLARFREDGSAARKLEYGHDAAGRLLWIRQKYVEDPPEYHYWKEFEYATANVISGNISLEKGKLKTARRLNRVGVPLGAAGAPVTVRVTETYAYGGRQGRPSSRSTGVRVGGIDQESWSFSAEYEPLGNVSSLAYPVCTGGDCGSGAGTPARSVAFEYTRGLLTSIPGWTTSGQAITYHTNLQVSQVNHSNGLNEVIANDPQGMLRPRSISTTGVAPAWSTGTISFDGSGNIIQMGASPQWDRFQYDRVSRLIEADLGSDVPAAKQKSTFDLYGNLVALQTGNGPIESFPVESPNNTNRLDGGTYDPAGNLVSWNLNAYGYDPLNMMTEICTTGSLLACTGERWAHVYTADDERLWSLNANTGREVWTVRDFGARLLTRDVQDPKQRLQLDESASLLLCQGANPVFCDGFESGGTGAWTGASQGRDVSDYVWRGGKLLGAAYVTGGGARHFAVDHLGTVRLVVSDVDPEVLAQPNYYPFGREVTTTTQFEEPMKFTGHERDAFDTLPVGDDVDYMHARFRSPLTGRFLSVDIAPGSARHPQSWNRYAYTQGNPMAYTDPNGLVRIRATQTSATFELAPGRGYFMYQIEFTGRPEYLRDKAISMAKRLGKRGAKWGSAVMYADKAIETLHNAVISTPGETTVPSTLLSGWSVAGLEGTIRSRLEKASNKLTGATGHWDIADLAFLQDVIDDVLAELEGDGEIDEEQRKELRLIYDIQRLRHEAEGRGRSGDSRQSLRNPNDPFAGTGFCDASNTCH